MILYNTLTRKEEPFVPSQGNIVRMYACGLTVYARGHIGNFRTVVSVDLLRRTLKYLGGYAVRQVVNFTDVDDRTIAGAQKAGLPLREYTAQYIDAFLEDYACLADGLLALYETTGNSRWLDEATSLAHTIIDRFADPDGGPFFSTSADHEQLISRPREIVDNAVPSGNSVAAELLLRLAVHTGDNAFREQALDAITPLQHAATQEPLAFGRLLCAVDMATSPQRELAIVGEPGALDTRALLSIARRRFDPNLVVGIASPLQASQSHSPMFLSRDLRDTRATAWAVRAFPDAG